MKAGRYGHSDHDRLFGNAMRRRTYLAAAGFRHLRALSRCPVISEHVATISYPNGGGGDKLDASADGASVSACRTLQWLVPVLQLCLCRVRRHHAVAGGLDGRPCPPCPGPLCCGGSHGRFAGCMASTTRVGGDIPYVTLIGSSIRFGLPDAMPAATASAISPARSIRRAWIPIQAANAKKSIAGSIRSIAMNRLLDADK